MPGIFGGLANAVGGAEQFADEEHRRKELEAQADQATAINRAATLAALANQGILPTGQVPAKAVDTGGLPLKAVPDLVTPGPDTTRYTPIGTTGYSQDQTRTAQALQARELARQEREANRRVAFLKATHPEYRNLPDETVRGIADDEKGFGEIAKPVPPDYSDVPPGVSTIFDKHSGTMKPTGQPARPLPPVEGSPEWVKAQGDAAAARAQARQQYQAQGSGNAPITPEDRERVALDQRLSGLQRQITNSRADLKTEQGMDLDSIGTKIDANAGTPDSSSQVTRAAARQAAIQHRVDSLGKAADPANARLAQIAATRSLGRAGVVPVAPRSAPPAAPAGRAGITDEHVNQSDALAENDPVVIATAANIGKSFVAPDGSTKTFTLDDVAKASKLTPAQKQAIQRVAARRGH